MILLGDIIKGRYKITDCLRNLAPDCEYLALDLTGGHGEVLFTYLSGYPSFHERSNFGLVAEELNKIDCAEIPRILDAGNYAHEHSPGMFFTPTTFIVTSYKADMKRLEEEKDSLLKRDIKTKIKILLKIARALETLHQNGFIYIRAPQILLSGDDTVHLGGLYDITKIPLAEAMLRADPYSNRSWDAPETFPRRYFWQEKASLRICNERCNIYSFGAIAYFIFTGRTFNTLNDLRLLPASFLPAHFFAGGAVEIPFWLQKLTDRCTAVNPAKRFQTMSEVILFIEKHRLLEAKQHPLRKVDEQLNSSWHHFSRSQRALCISFIVGLFTLGILLSASFFVPLPVTVCLVALIAPFISYVSLFSKRGRESGGVIAIFMIVLGAVVMISSLERPFMPLAVMLCLIAPGAAGMLEAFCDNAFGVRPDSLFLSPEKGFIGQ